MKLIWVTTAPSGRAHTHGADDGQTGWRLHLVNEEELVDVKKFTKFGLIVVAQGKALCGLRPGTGWGLDLFIDEPCIKCQRAAEKRNLTLPEIPR